MNRTFLLSLLMFASEPACSRGTVVDLVAPAVTMCFWGVAYTLGPNYNLPMLPDRAQAAWEVLTRAKATMQNAAPVEQALVDALSKR